MEHHVTVGERREWWSSEWQLWTTGVRVQERLSKIRARPPVRLRLVLTLGWTDERRRRTCEQQVVRKKVLRVSRVNPVCCVFCCAATLSSVLSACSGTGRSWDRSPASVEFGIGVGAFTGRKWNGVAGGGAPPTLPASYIPGEVARNACAPQRHLQEAPLGSRSVVL